MFADYHVHTSFSDDSVCPMNEIIQKAIQLGMQEIAFTEHVDYGVKTDLNCNYIAYLDEISKMKEIYHGQLTIKTGIEFGVQPHTIPQFEQDFAKYPFDFIILSNHQTDNLEYWNNHFQPGKTQSEIHSRYYETTYTVVQQYKHYSVLGHLDMIKRYDPFGEYPDACIMDMADAILRQVIEDGKGIEVNTSCFKYGLKDLTPSRTLLTRYRELGGEILTLGSDTHESIHLGDHFTETREILRTLGFRWLCTFEQMHPTFWPM